MTGGGSIQNNASATGLAIGNFAISGTKFFQTTTNFSLTLSTAQAAFGFYGVDIGDVGGCRTLTFVGGKTTTVAVPPPTQNANGSVLFFGVIGSISADLFTSLTFTDTTSGDDFAFDNLSIGRLSQVVATPEPATFISAGMAGLVGFGYLRRQRREKVAA